MTMENQPDFNRIRRALLLEGEPDRVPLYDEFERGIMSNWLGKQVSGLETSVEFRIKASYDYILIRVDLWSALQQGKGGRLPEKGRKASIASIMRYRESGQVRKRGILPSLLRHAGRKSGQGREKVSLPPLRSSRISLGPGWRIWISPLIRG